ncbi:hypothetical protein EZV62_023584 [Acer yangbiense]|uniref:Germin-like protein n=1 Tax=Acer yangbiense TaxID=1000413 RepID=A0A5C7H288_9ROSI|nr:hypothetical protein EZV62_023584 [Acer yangbiense]
MAKVFHLLSFNSLWAPQTRLIPIPTLLSFFSSFKDLLRWGLWTPPTSFSVRHYRQVTCLYFPKGLVHFQYNVDAQKPAMAFSAFGSANAGTVSLPITLFATSIDDMILAKAFKTDVATIQALKANEATSHHQRWSHFIYQRWSRSREGAERFGSIFEGDLFGGVDGGNGVDDDGRGKEVEDPKEGEVTDLEEPEEDPFRGNSIGEVVSFGGIELDAVEVFVLKRIFK